MCYKQKINDKLIFQYLIHPILLSSIGILVTNTNDMDMVLYMQNICHITVAQLLMWRPHHHILYYSTSMYTDLNVSKNINLMTLPLTKIGENWNVDIFRSLHPFDPC